MKYVIRKDIFNMKKKWYRCESRRYLCYATLHSLITSLCYIEQRFKKKKRGKKNIRKKDYAQWHSIHAENKIAFLYIFIHCIDSILFFLTGKQKMSYLFESLYYIFFYNSFSHFGPYYVFLILFCNVPYIFNIFII